MTFSLSLNEKGFFYFAYWNLINTNLCFIYITSFYQDLAGDPTRLDTYRSTTLNKKCKYNISL